MGQDVSGKHRRWTLQDCAVIPDPINAESQVKSLPTLDEWMFTIGECKFIACATLVLRSLRLQSDAFFRSMLTFNHMLETPLHMLIPISRTTTRSSNRSAKRLARYLRVFVSETINLFDCQLFRMRSHPQYNRRLPQTNEASKDAFAGIYIRRYQPLLVLGWRYLRHGRRGSSRCEYC
jgi:hypothetical protein